MIRQSRKSLGNGPRSGSLQPASRKPEVIVPLEEVTLTIPETNRRVDSSGQARPLAGDQLTFRIAAGVKIVEVVPRRV